MQPSTPRIIAFGVGFLSLSQEILWTRIVSFAYLTKPQAFSLVLALYLLGIALGASGGRAICRRPHNLLAAAGGILVVSGVADIFVVGMYAATSESAGGLISLSASIVITAALKSALFPIAHHLGSNDVVAGKGVSFSRVYVSNVFGSAVGPLVTGLFLLQVATLQQSFLIIAALTLALSCFSLSRAKMHLKSKVAGVIGASMAITLITPNLLTPTLATNRHDGNEIVAMFENRSGIVHTVSGGDHGDIVFGNNVYDGRINTDLSNNSNGIHRAYVLAAMHRDPRNVLVIGLSGGAWTKVISEFPTVEKIDVVEINPSYLELISLYPDVAPIISDSRISFHIDDGRRWLRLNSDNRYDLIVMNSIHHWRSNATNLLSREFMALAKERLGEGGIFYVNSTDSPDVLETASSVFNYAFRYENFVAASNDDFRPNLDLYRFRYLEIFGAPDVDSASAISGRIQKIYDVPIVGLDEVRLDYDRDLEVIRDDNMITEYKYGAGFL